MSLSDQERLGCVHTTAPRREDLRAVRGHLGHDAIEGDTVRLSVPTRFLKSWVQSIRDSCWLLESRATHHRRSSGAPLGGAAQRHRKVEDERAGQRRARSR